MQKCKIITARGWVGVAGGGAYKIYASQFMKCFVKRGAHSVREA
jgi:hypothetical protein